MGISEQDFQREMNHAQSMVADSSDEMKEYWRSYMRGLRRLYHGNKFETEAIHKVRYAMADSKNPNIARKGEGYRAGFHFDAHRGGNPVGRKQVGDTRLSGPKVWAQEKKELYDLCALIGEYPSDYMRRVIMAVVHNDMRRFKKE
jgi:hypothetical protein